MTELFETFDDHGNPTGLVPRPRVHAEGLWHRSAHVLLFTSDGKLYLQRRALDKDLYANRWDYSVGEHLKPGESYHAGALRGLREELGLPDIHLQPLGPVRASVTAVPECQVLDRELQQAFRGVWDGEIRPDPAEVADVRPVGLPDLARWTKRQPEAFTPWFLRELEALQILL
jgi:isopentenyldiphosphate isomerase